MSKYSSIQVFNWGMRGRIGIHMENESSNAQEIIYSIRQFESSN